MTGPAPGGGVDPGLLDRTTLDRAIVDHSVGPLLDAAGVDTVALALVDSSGVLRQKQLSVTAAARAFERGWSFIDAVEWWRPDDTLVAGGPAGASSHPAAIDTGSGRPYPFAPGAAFFLADFADPLRQLSPRFALQRLVDRAAASGLVARVGWEFEYIVLEADGRASLPDNRCWSAGTLASTATTLRDLTALLEGWAVPVDHLCAELGPGCMELALGPQEAVTSADSAALSKVATHAFYAGRGRQATFMAQLGPAFPGLGGHPSLSLHSPGDTAPLLVETDGTLSDTAAAAIAGIVELLPDLLLLAAPTPNSYRRLVPGNWAPRTATWGVENYSCALRVAAADPAAARLELRIPGADTAPHTCLAMLLGAAVWGIERGLTPPGPVEPPRDGRIDHDGRPLPRDVVEAAQRLLDCKAAGDLFGDEFVEHQAARGMAEAAVCQRFVSDDERRRYLSQV